MLTVLNIKIDGKLLKEIDRSLEKHRYSTRSEFVREAIRDKLSKLEKEALLKQINSVRGILKKRTTDEDLHKARDTAFIELGKKF